jgi:proline iminopeptidase
MQTQSGTVAMTDGVQVYFEKTGSGEKTVLVPNGMYLREDFAVLAGGRTVIFYDVRNRGRSDTVTDAGKLARGIQQDVDDLDVVRRHFGVERVDVIGHSYVGLMVGLYAMKYPESVGRVVQIGPAQPDAGAEYPAHLTGADETLSRVMAEVGRMMSERPPGDPEEVCRKFWAVLGEIYVMNPADAGKINWGRCELANERNFMRYWMGPLSASIQSLKLTAEDFAAAKAPVLIVHGRKDRNAPYGGARDWAMRWPDARLLTIPDAAHAPWIEAPELVRGGIRTFLDGAWPEGAERVAALAP